MSSKTWNFKPELLEAYRRTGHELIPLHDPGALDQRGRKVGKAPYKGWRTDPALSVDEALTHMAEGKNVGVRLRPCDLVIDVDPRNFKEGDDPLKRLGEDLDMDFEDYPKVITGSGGYHFYMSMPEGTVLRDTLEDYQGIEFKAHGRQVVSAGSAHPDTAAPYMWSDDPLAVDLSDEVPPAPAELIAVALRPGRLTTAVDAGDISPEQLGDMLEALDPTDYQDHTEWLELMMAAHHATGGDGRDEFLEWSTSDPKYSGDAWLIGRRWDSLHADQTGKRITQRTLFKKLVEADRRDLLPRTTAEEDFAEVSSDTTDEELQEIIDSLPEGDPALGPLEQLNARGYAAVMDQGQFRVYRQALDYSWIDDRGQTAPRQYWEVMKKGDFLDIMSNVRIQKTGPDGTTSTVPLAAEWLKWGGRTTFQSVVFDPGCKVPKNARALNLWTDWAEEPKKGDWSVLRQLLFEGLCDGDEEAFNYILDWSAFMVQYPERQAEVAVVMKGQKGTGKGTYFRCLAELAGRHGMHISNQHHFTNHFNAHLRDCIFLFADEAMWAGDKKAEGTLKALITEPSMIIEGKGKDVITAKNYLHVAMASNEDWVIPASMEDERRFAVFEVNPKFRGNKAFFTRLYRQLADGGKQALLWDLKTRDISKYHPRGKIPQTSALAQQKLQSLDGFDSWWYESLCTGELSEMDPLGGEDWASGQVAIPVDDLKMSLENHLRKIGDRYFGRKSMDVALGLKFKKRVPTGLKKVRMPAGAERMDLKVDKSGRTYAYVFPSLQTCRAQFEDQIGSALTWNSSGGAASAEPHPDEDIVDIQTLDDLAYDPLAEEEYAG